MDRIINEIKRRLKGEVIRMDKNDKSIIKKFNKGKMFKIEL